MLRSVSVATKRIGLLLPKISVRYSSDLEQYTIYDVAYYSLNSLQKAEGTYFEELDEEGFLINGNYYKGGVLAFNNLALLWDVQSLDEITPESLKPVTLYNPPIGGL